MSDDLFENGNDEEEKDEEHIEGHDYVEHDDEHSSTEIYDGDSYDEKDIPEEIYLEEPKIEHKYTSGNRKNRRTRRNKKEKKSFRGSFISYLLLTLVVAIIGGSIGAYFGPAVLNTINDGSKDGDTFKSPTDQQEIVINPKDEMETATAVAKKAMSSVVGITTLERKTFLHMEGDVEGVGSGVIVDSNGLILTNSHVVADGNAQSVSVLLDSGETLDAEVLWNDSLLDLAMIKIDASNLPVADLGDSDKLKVGETAIAIGNPLGLEFQRTVTSGIISGLNRSIQVEGSLIIDDLIQTDASINPGNSGGPLLNSKGEVIGINTAKITSGEGLGFAIPINNVKPIIDSVVEKGTYETVALGIAGLGVSEYKARAVDGGENLPDEGVMVLELEPGAPADNAGIEPMDVIVKIDNEEIKSFQDLRKELYTFNLEDEAVFTVIRDGKEVELNVKFTEVNQ